MQHIIKIILILVIIVLPIWATDGCYKLMEKENKDKEKQKNGTY